MLRALQLWHVALLAAIPVLYSIFRITSEPHDAMRSAIESLTYVTGGTWLAYTLVLMMLRGKGEDASASALSAYRKLLTVKSFVVAVNAVGTVVVLVLAYQVLFYRQVEFVSATPLEIECNDRIGESVRVGFLAANSPTRFRIHTGTRLLVFRALASGEVIGSMSVHVSPVVVSPSLIHVSVKEDRRVKKLE